MRFSRRSVLKATGAAGAATLLPYTGSGVAQTPTIDGQLETDSADLQEVLVVFDSNDNVDLLSQFDLDAGYFKFDVLPIGYAKLTGDQIATVAEIPAVRYVQANRELDYHNEDSREATGADIVQNNLFYTGETAHSVVIDSGIDGDHPDHETNLQHNWRYVDPLDEGTMWVDAGPADTDDNGHGTHTSGSVAGDGTASDGKYKGMAPDAELTVYSSGATLLILQAVGAYDHLLSRVEQGKTEVQIVSNSYGTSSPDDFVPSDALNVATWEAFQRDILSVFSAGNAGPGENTLNNYTKAPHVLGVAATMDDKSVTDFSSRGRFADYDGGGEGAQYDRELALSNLTDYFDANLADQPVLTEESYSGTVGPGSSDAGVGDSVYQEWTAPEQAGYVEADVSWTPPGQDLDIYLHQGAKDGPVVASGATLDNPEHVAGAVNGGQTYFFEIVPYANVSASWTIDLVSREAPPKGQQPEGPFGIYRNGVGANGNLVMSTLSPDDPLQAYAGLSGPEEQDSEIWYGRISGTSMSCPVTAGVCTLVVDAYYQNHSEYPDPLDVLLIVEASAKDVRGDYNPANMGAGFVDAVAAVKLAEENKPHPAKFKDVDLTSLDSTATDTVFEATGSRADDGSVFTAGQTNRVDITVDSSTGSAFVRDAIPFDWTLVGGDDATVYTEDGTRYVEFTNPVGTVGEGDHPVTRTYFLEAPDSTGTYEFGPAEAISTFDESKSVTLTGTDGNTVGGVDTS
ncbi:S8 family serine peptidase [Haladaptatus sp. YSMS36]|uniref:S8 family serine peptidase n=1 Tax=Haladaptatus sp. YSMS36 TaxID=3033384 RepID=UPI0023E7D2CB|nr:S8 family serine peptidase [Haladaptatus sp. YSMS36]